ncbi:MAG: hypothetical protein EA412_00235 [Chitinophagaceae bacterium]|nr:MAG: hypothetical protein EA412_00235 [Chitinophagaceae bacterium]
MKLQILFRTFLIALFSICIISITGCNKDEDEPPAREKFFGTYNVNENCSFGNDNYTVTITASSASEDAVVISNFYNIGVAVRANVSSSGTELNYNDTQDGINFSGSGSISGNTLTLIFTASQGGATDNCTATAIKQ